MLHLVCGVRVCRVAHWLSHTMLRACCWLYAVRCSPHTKYGSAACARVLLHVVCCLLHGVCCMLPVARRRLIAVCRPLRVACRLLHTARCMAHGVSTLCVARCMASVASSPYVACRLLAVALVSCTLPQCVSSAARSPLHVARPPMPVPRSHVAWGALPVACPTSHLVRCTLRAASRLLPVASFTFACRMVSLIRCLSHLSCCMSSSCRVTQRRRTRSASRRRSRLRPQRPARLRAESRPRCACVRACVRAFG